MQVRAHVGQMECIIIRLIWGNTQLIISDIEEL